MVCREFCSVRLMLMFSEVQGTHRPDLQSGDSGGQCVICEDSPAVMAAVDCGYVVIFFTIHNYIKGNPNPFLGT
jgi:hypothetical protein